MNLEICYTFRECYIALLQLPEPYKKIGYWLIRTVESHNAPEYNLNSFKRMMDFKDTEFFKKSSMGFDYKSKFATLEFENKEKKKKIRLIFKDDSVISYTVMEEQNFLFTGELKLRKEGNKNELDSLLYMMN